jgi:hypothetical protein
MIWNVGQVKIIKILEYAGGGAGATALLPFAVPQEIAKMPWLLPHYANADSTLKLNVQSWLVVTPTLKIVVDTAGTLLPRGRQSAHALDQLAKQVRQQIKKHPGRMRCARS